LWTQSSKIYNKQIPPNKNRKAIKDTIGKADTALICVDFAEVGKYDPEEESFKDYINKRKKYFRGKTELTENYVSGHLFLGLDSVAITNVWNGETVEKKSLHDYISESDFYLIGSVLDKPLYNGIL